MKYSRTTKHAGLVWIIPRSRLRKEQRVRAKSKVIVKNAESGIKIVQKNICAVETHIL